MGARALGYRSAAVADQLYWRKIVLAMSQPLGPFLEGAFRSITPICDGVGLVRVSPNYTKPVNHADKDNLTDEMIRLLRTQHPRSDRLAEPQGLHIQIPATYPLLKQYVERIILEREGSSGSWVQVSPHGWPIGRQAAL